MDWEVQYHRLGTLILINVSYLDTLNIFDYGLRSSLQYHRLGTLILINVSYVDTLNIFDYGLRSTISQTWHINVD